MWQSGDERDLFFGFDLMKGELVPGGRVENVHAKLV